MKIDEFEAAVDTQIETNPLARLKRCARNIIDTRLCLAKLSGEQIERFAAPALKKLFDDAKTAIERGSFNIDKYLFDFDGALLERLRSEREKGELRPITAESEINDHRTALSDKLYRTPELDALHHLIKNNERITSIGWWTIETDRQVIRRDDLRKATRPASFMNGPAWRKQFVSDEQVQEAINTEERRKQPIRGSGPSRWIE